MDVEAVFRAHHEELFRYLARHCGDPQEAKDAVQETFVRLLQRPPARVEAIRAWLFKTGMNVIRDRYRIDAKRRKILGAHSHRVPVPTPEASPEESAERREDRDRLRRALAGLREKERTALLLREAGFKHREIAEALDTTTGTVGTLIARSIAKLAEAMNIQDQPS